VTSDQAGPRPPQVGRSGITAAEMRQLAAGITGVPADDVEDVMLLILAKGGGVGITGSGHLQGGPAMILALTAGIDRVVAQMALGESGPTP
jgi:hypothetical protein